jgi:hypothetical protein
MLPLLFLLAATLDFDSMASLHAALKLSTVCCGDAQTKVTATKDDGGQLCGNGVTAFVG